MRTSNDSKTNLRALDLNLLVVLDRLLAERSVTSAARSLGMTQPAASHALKRLRAWFDDDLLRREGNAMQLTPRAEALAEPVARVLAGVRALGEAQPLPLASVEREVRVSMVDFAAAALAPPLLAELSQRAPGITLTCLSWALPDVEIEGLRRGRRDLALTTAGPKTLARAPAELRSESLGEVAFVGLARQGHPMFAERPRDPLRHRFAIASAEGRTSTPLDEALAPRRRHIVASLPQYLVAPLVVEASDLLMYVPRPLARLWSSRGDLRTFAAPPELQPQPVALLWHRRTDDDPAHRFVRESLARLARRALVSRKR